MLQIHLNTAKVQFIVISLDKLKTLTFQQREYSFLHSLMNSQSQKEPYSTSSSKTLILPCVFSSGIFESDKAMSLLFLISSRMPGRHQESIVLTDLGGTAQSPGIFPSPLPPKFPSSPFSFSAATKMVSPEGRNEP